METSDPESIRALQFFPFTFTFRNGLGSVLLLCVVVVVGDASTMQVSAFITLERNRGTSRVVFVPLSSLNPPPGTLGTRVRWPVDPTAVAVVGPADVAGAAEAAVADAGWAARMEGSTAGCYLLLRDSASSSDPSLHSCNRCMIR